MNNTPYTVTLTWDEWVIVVYILSVYSKSTQSYNTAYDTAAIHDKITEQVTGS